MSAITKTLKRNVYGVAAVVLTAAVTVPNILVGQVYAAQITARSIQMESAEPSATGLEYSITFTPATTDDIESVVVDFCEESPLIGGSSCTQPTSMVVGTSVTSETATGNWDAQLDNSNRTLVLSGTAGAVSMPAATPVNFVVDGFTNTSDLGTFYARILTFDTEAGALAYTHGTPGTHIDNGGVALSTSNDIDVSAAVLETLTFCVSAAAPTQGCGGVTSPALELGEGTPKALSTAAVSTATAYFQLNTNAQGATYVNIAGDTLTNGSNDINAAGALAAITAGTEEFGLRVADGTETGGGQGVGAVGGDAAYEHGANYAFVTGAGGIDAPYGDTIASATGAVQNINVPITFGATISATTAAGLYTSDLSLIATSAY